MVTVKQERLGNETMTSKRMLNQNVLGDLRAEADIAMLERTFVETPDYRALIESTVRAVVVGRRGTGKSALLYMLSKYWRGVKGVVVLSIAPEEEQIIPIRTQLALFGDKVTRIRTGAKIIWRYALILELVNILATKYKAATAVEKSTLLAARHKAWISAGPDILTRIRNTLSAHLSGIPSPDERIGELPRILDINRVQEEFANLVSEQSIRCVVLIDKLDEGYDPDVIGIGHVDGVIYAATELSTRCSEVQTYTFLRDNIFRAVADADPDFSRNIEGQVLRLHWDAYQLLNLACNRLRVVFDLTIENNQRLWDRCTANELQSVDGFKKCLQLTLYRPRDLLILLNQAFYAAAKQNRDQIILADVEGAAKTISKNRLDDLHKEYDAIIPGIKEITSCFHTRPPELSYEEAGELLTVLLESSDFPAEVLQQLAIFGRPIEVLQALHSIGFIGIYDAISSSYVFCHDGRDSEVAISNSTRFLVHPCYWLSLGLTKNSLKPEEAQEINDEYEIQVSSKNPEIRSARIGRYMSELAKIPIGDQGAQDFEQWCLDVIKIIFAGALRNIEHHPNKANVQRRDIVALNLSRTDLWKRIYEDYETRQVIFECKNFQDMGSAEYRQMLSYLSGEYGRLGFLICRDEKEDLSNGKDLNWFKEMHAGHKVMIVKLTGKFLWGILAKIRSPQKHDAGEDQLHKLLDVYARLYIGNSANVPRRDKRKSAKHATSKP